MFRENNYTVKYTLFVFICMFISSIFIVLTVALTNILGWPFHRFDLVTFTIILLVFFVCFGTLIAFIISNHLSKQQNEIEKVIKEVVSGNFDVQINDDNAFDGQMAENINKMIKELKNVKILKSDFISNFSHEFKTPIVSIKGFSEILLNEKLPQKKQKEFLQIIYDESDRLSKLSNNMLLLSNLESSAIVPEKENFQLDEQLSSVLKLLSNEINAKNLQLDLNLTTASFFGNIDMISQVWINIISNAIKYSFEGGKISVFLEIHDKVAVVKIKDTGKGISQNDLPHVFEKFYQADHSRATNGNGLGLAIAKQIVGLHNGEISVNSKENEWTEFTVKLPLGEN